MMRITREVFDSMLPPDWPRGHPLLHEEVGWLADGGYLGVIVRDRYDNDYGWVLLRRGQPPDHVPVFVEVASSFETAERAREELLAKRSHT